MQQSKTATITSDDYVPCYQLISRELNFVIFAILEKSQNLVLAKIKIEKFNSTYTYP